MPKVPSSRKCYRADRASIHVRINRSRLIGVDVGHRGGPLDVCSMLVETLAPVGSVLVPTGALAGV